MPKMWIFDPTHKHGARNTLWLLAVVVLLFALIVLCGPAPAAERYFDPYPRDLPYYGPSNPLPRYYGEPDNYRPWVPPVRSYPRHQYYTGRGAIWNYQYWQRRGWR